MGFNESVSAEYESLKPQLNDAREIKMEEVIMDYHSRESSKPLLAIIGHTHAMEKSKIIKADTKGRCTIYSIDSNYFDLLQKYMNSITS